METPIRAHLGQGKTQEGSSISQRLRAIDPLHEPQLSQLSCVAVLSTIVRNQTVLLSLQPFSRASKHFILLELMPQELDDVYMLFDLSNSEPRPVARFSALKTALFRVLYEPQDAAESPTLAYYAWFAGEAMVETLHLVSLLYREKEEMSGWVDTSPLWKVLAFTRVDKVFAQLDQLYVWTYISTSLSLLPLTLLLFLLTQEIRFRRHTHRLSHSLFLPLSAFLSHALFLPCLCTAAAQLKYSFFRASHMPEYFDLPSSFLVPSPFQGAALGLSGLLVVVIGLGEAALMFEISMELTSGATCAHSRTRVWEKLAETALVSLHFSILSMHWLAYKSVFFAVSVAISGLTLYDLPYNNRFFNYIHMARWGVSALASLSFLIGSFMDNASVVLALFLTLTGPVLLFLRAFLRGREQGLGEMARREKAEAGSMYGEELVFRWKINQLRDKGNLAKEDVIAILGDFAQFSSSYSSHKLITIWEAHFCFDFLHDERLARIKLAKTLTSPSSLIDDFQEFRLREKLSAENCEYHEEVDFMNYQTVLGDVRKSDEQFCFLLLTFWSELNSRELNWSRLEHLIFRIDSSIASLHTLYKSLTKRYPKSPSGLRLYGTFLRDLCNEPKKAEKVLKRAETEVLIQERASRGEQTMQQFTYFNETNGLMIISGSERGFGTVTFANGEAAHTLGYPTVVSLVGMDVNSIVPPPFTENHHLHMQKFLRTCTSSAIELPFTVFMRKLNGNITEVYTSMKCTALCGEPFFIVAMRARTVTREIALISPDRRIYVHTDGFPEVALGTYANLQSKHVDELFPFFSQMSAIKRLFHPFRAATRTHDLTLMLARSIINRVQIDILMVLTDPAEVDRWKSDCDREKRMLAYNAEDSPFLGPASSSQYNLLAIKSEESSNMLLKSFQRRAQRRDQIVDRTQYLKEITKIKIEKTSLTSGGNPKESAKTGDRVTSVIQTIYPKRQLSRVDEMLKRRIKQSTSRLKVLLLVLTGIVVTGNVGVLVYVESFAAAREEANTVLQFLELPYWMTEISDLAREIDLSAQKNTLQPDSELFPRLCNLTTLIFSLKSTLINSSSKLASYLRSHPHSFPVWTRLNDTEKYQFRAVETTLGDFVSHVSASQGLKVCESKEIVGFSSPSLYFLYRNGAGDSFRAINQTGYEFVGVEMEDIREFQAGMVAACVAFGVGAVCCSLLLLPVLASIQRTSIQIWSFFSSLQLAHILAAKTKCLERLDQEYGHDLSAALSPHAPQYPLGSHSSRAMRGVSLVWLGLVGKLVCYLALSAGYYYWISYAGADKLSGLYKSYLTGVQDLTQIRTLFRLSELWFTEESVTEAYGSTTQTACTGERSKVLGISGDIRWRQGEIFEERVGGLAEGLFRCDEPLPEVSTELRSSESVTSIDLLSLPSQLSLPRLRTVISSITSCQSSRITSLSTYSSQAISETRIGIVAVIVVCCCVTVGLYYVVCRRDVAKVEIRLKKVWKMRKMVAGRDQDE